MFFQNYTKKKIQVISKIVFFAFLFFLAVSPNANSGSAKSKELPFKLIDLEKFTSSMPEMKIAKKKMQEAIKRIQEPIQKKFEEYQNLLKALQNSDINKVKREALEKKAEILQEELRRDQAEFQNKLNEQKVKIFDPVEKKMKQTIAKYAISKKIPAVFGYSQAGLVLLYNEEDVDITQDIINTLD